MATKERLKLIDYDEVRKLFDEEFKRVRQLIDAGETHLDNLAEGFHQADGVIWKLPTVDAVEVVRCENCRDCEMCYPEKQLDREATQAWICKRYKRFTKPDDFCSYGERREGE